MQRITVCYDWYFGIFRSHDVHQCSIIFIYSFCNVLYTRKFSEYKDMFLVKSSFVIRKNVIFTKKMCSHANKFMHCVIKKITNGNFFIRLINAFECLIRESFNHIENKLVPLQNFKIILIFIWFILLMNLIFTIFLARPGLELTTYENL